MKKIITFADSEKRILLPGHPDYDRQLAFNAVSRTVADAFRPSVNNFLASSGGAGPIGDAGEAVAFTVGQLAYTEMQVWERVYTPMQFEEFLPISTEGGPAATDIRYEIVDYIGQAAANNGAGDDIPMADMVVGEKTFKVKGMAIGYRYTHQELLAAALLRKPVPTGRQEAAIRAYQRTVNSAALFGDTASNLPGFFNHPSAPTGNAPTGNWLAATADQILTDINTGIYTVWAATAFTEQVTDIVLPPVVFNRIASLRSSAYSDMTVLEYIKANNVAKAREGRDIKFSCGIGSDTIGAGGTKRTVFYSKAERNLKMHITQPLTFLAPQLRNLDIVIPGFYRHSGVELRYPKTMYYMDNC